MGQVLLEGPAAPGDGLRREVPAQLLPCGHQNQVSSARCSSGQTPRCTPRLLTGERDTLHLVGVVPAQRGVEPLEVGVAAGDDGGGLIVATGLNDVDGVELERRG